MDGEHLREILDSPLDDRPRSPGFRILGWVFAALLPAAAAVIWLVLGSGGDEDGGAASTSAAAAAVASTTSSTTTTTTLPGTVGYPGARFLPGFTATDAGAVMLFGIEPTPYLVGELFEEIWAYETAGDIWRRIDSRPQPPARFDFGAAYDSGNERVVMFGGGVLPCYAEAISRDSPSGVRRCYELLDDTWLFDPAAGTWEQVQILEGPGARSAHAMAYDPGSGTVVLFGGVILTDASESVVYLADTWVFDTAARTWTEVTPEVSPGARGEHTMAYDAESGRIVLWSGLRSSPEDPLLWAYDPATNTWEPLETTGGPEESWDGTLVDAPGRGMILLEGQGITTSEIAEGITTTGIGWRSLVWHLDLGTGDWTERDPPAWPLEFQGAAAHVGSGQVLVWSGDVTLRYDPATGVWERGSAVVQE